jgi:hypothetical protein
VRKTINPLSSYIKPHVTPPLPKIRLFLWRDFQVSFWRLFSACSAPTRGKHATKTHRLTGGWGRSIWLGLAHFHNGYSFLMISPNLLDIWPLFLLIPSRYETAHFLTLLRPPDDGYSLLGSKK